MKPARQVHGRGNEVKILFRATALLVAAPALANTWIVDAAGGPGSHFTDIPSAIGAAVAGDILLVRPGSYSAFTLDEPLVIVAQAPGVVVGNTSSSTNVENIVLGSKAALAGMRIEGILYVTSCSTEIVLDELVLPYGRVQVQNCADVRLRACSVTGRDGANTSNPYLGFHHGHPAILVDASRVEVVDCDLLGGDGGDCIPCQTDGGWGGDGGPGIDVRNLGEVHVSRSNLTGGDGGDAAPAPLFVEAYGGFGGNAMVVGSYPYNASTGQVSGQPAQVFQGGAGGYGYGFGGWSQEGGGHGLVIAKQAAARTSGVTFLPGPLQSKAIQVDPGGTHEPAVPDDPTLRIVDAPLAGQVVTFRINAPAVSFVTLLLGRNAKVSPLPGLGEDLLIVPSRAIPLGFVDGSGVISFNQPIPAALGPGFVLHAQCKVELSGTGELRYTNSTPLVLR